MEICELAKLIPLEELNRKLSYGCSELDPSFLCFDYCYKAVSEVLPRNFTIVDLGCYQAAQCYYFKDFDKYIGVDCYDQTYSREYVPPLRFISHNTTHYVETIQQYLAKKQWDNTETYFIMSGVPNRPCMHLMKNLTENYLWWYPREKPIAQGILSDDILERVNKYLAEN